MIGHARDRRYPARSQHDLLALPRAQPMLAALGRWRGCRFTPLPQRAECAAAGRLARRNPHVSPSWLGMTESG
ncbi:hypothetical protein [Xanthomonas graminis]|uniref:hypothetical protein n=1 Tax=Xanthomonas graminis TaxID=3390026 RepID=UPI0006B2F2A2|nr:hypothetical protein [Xanthomonas translucens]UKE65892.1 hypothetical protein KM547_00420 [Xanthomonas translucens pv. phlei]UKE73515.1 hypothetical protein KFS85_00600 [Xanthomonas translucens pv. phleipratensis]